jgi:hypothetical protein
MARPSFPKTLREFQAKFASEEACRQYLASCRWPDGFVCLRCGNRRAYELARQRHWQCAACGRQVSLTAKTILHNTKTPLSVSCLLLYPAEMPFFLRLSCGDFGLHMGRLPGYPASHGCIRLPEKSARRLYASVPIGTLVEIQ